MSNKLEEKINSMRGNLLSFNPSSHDDAIAKKTLWSSVKPLECGFRTHCAHEVSSSRLEFRGAQGAKLFYLLFVTCGIGMITMVVYNLLLSNPELVDTVMQLLIELCFAGVGGGMYYFWTLPFTFDKTLGFFWKGRKTPQELMNSSNTEEKAVRLKDFYALQILAKHCRGKHKSIKGYELNLILANAERVHLASHTNLVVIRGDAEILAKFLDVSTWDAV